MSHRYDENKIRKEILLCRLCKKPCLGRKLLGMHEYKCLRGLRVAMGFTEKQIAEFEAEDREARMRFH